MSLSVKYEVLRCMRCTKCSVNQRCSENTAGQDQSILRRSVCLLRDGRDFLLGFLKSDNSRGIFTAGHEHMRASNNATTLSCCIHQIIVSSLPISVQNLHFHNDQQANRYGPIVLLLSAN